MYVLGCQKKPQTEKIRDVCCQQQFVVTVNNNKNN